MWCGVPSYVGICVMQYVFNVWTCAHDMICYVYKHMCLVCLHVFLGRYVSGLVYRVLWLCVFHHYCILWHLDRLPIVCTMWLQVIISVCGEQQCLLIEVTKTMICLQGCPQSSIHPTLLESGAHNSTWLPGSVSWMAPNPSPNFFLTCINYVCMYVHTWTYIIVCRPKSEGMWSQGSNLSCQLGIKYASSPTQPS